MFGQKLQTEKKFMKWKYFLFKPLSDHNAPFILLSEPINVSIKNDALTNFCGTLQNRSCLASCKLFTLYVASIYLRVYLEHIYYTYIHVHICIHIYVCIYIYIQIYCTHIEIFSLTTDLYVQTVQSWMWRSGTASELLEFRQQIKVFSHSFLLQHLTLFNSKTRRNITLAPVCHHPFPLVFKYPASDEAQKKHSVQLVENTYW